MAVDEAEDPLGVDEEPIVVVVEPGGCPRGGGPRCEPMGREGEGKREGERRWGGRREGREEGKGVGRSESKREGKGRG